MQEALAHFPQLRHRYAAGAALSPSGEDLLYTVVSGNDSTSLPGGVVAALQAAAYAAMEAAPGLVSAITVTYRGHVTPLIIKSAPAAVDGSLQVVELILGDDIGHQLVQPGSLDAPKGGYSICVKAANGRTIWKEMAVVLWAQLILRTGVEDSAAADISWQQDANDKQICFDAFELGESS